MHHLDIRFGSRRYLICDPGISPDDRATGYGNLVRHVEQIVRTAASLDATLFLVRPRRTINAILYDLDSEEAQIVGQSDWRAKPLRMLWIVTIPVRYGIPGRWLADRAATTLRPVVEGGKHASRRLGWRSIERRLDRTGHALREVSHRYEKLVADRWHRLFAEGRERARATGSKKRPVRVRLRPEAQAEALRLAQGAGLDPARPVVTLHVREAGYRTREAKRQQDLDRIREARVETYRDAVAWLVGRGYQIVRIGDPTMTACPWPGVVDLAKAPWRTDAFELWAVLASRFFIASDSGPYFLAELGHVPALTVNVIQVGYYTQRPRDRYICKRVFHRTLGRFLSVSEMLSEELIRNPLNFDQYEWTDNTAEEIAEAVEDLVASLDRPPGERTPAQARHDRLVRELADNYRPEWRSRWSLVFRRGGSGTISARFAARYLDVREGFAP